MELSRKNNRAKNQVPRPNYQTPECKTAITIMESSLTDPKWPNFARPLLMRSWTHLSSGSPSLSPTRWWLPGTTSKTTVSFL